MSPEEQLAALGVSRLPPAEPARGNGEDGGGGGAPARLDLPGCPFACAVLVMVDENVERLDPAEDRKCRDGAGASQGPCGAQAELSRGHARFQTLSDVKALEHGVERVEHDGRAADRAEEASMDQILSDAH